MTTEHDTELHDRTASNGVNGVNGAGIHPDDANPNPNPNPTATAGTDLSPAELMAALSGPDLPEPDVRRSYAEQLLRHALETRDAEASVLVTRLMDTDPVLDERLHKNLNDAFFHEPDAAYSLIRARMASDPNPRWLFRLRVAAVCALQIAITDGDAETVLNWLRLIAREPASYGLTDVVHNGILAAAERAKTDGALGRLLIPLAIRRDPSALDVLLNDQQILDAMAAQTNLGRLLRDHEGDPLQTLQNLGQETFLLAMARAAQSRNGTVFTPASVDQVWAAYTSSATINVPPSYQPDSIIQSWLVDGADWLDESALLTLLGNAARDRRDDIFLGLIRQIAGRDSYDRLLGAALQRSARPEGDVQALISQLQTSGDLSPQGALDIYVRLLAAWEWRKSALPVVQQVARSLQQHATLNVAEDALWPLIALAAEARDETVTKVGARRLTLRFESMDDEVLLTEKLLRLVNETQWHAATRQYIVNWWRGFTRAQTLARLQRLDKALEGKKPLDDLRTIVQTVLGFRKMLGKRTLQQFAWDVGVAYGILQALSESFEPSSKRPVSFDQTTMRAEFDAHAGELTPHEQKIMANNFKELAALIAGMGDNRSKASLIRRGDDIDRLLMSGEQTPHSAVDALKWMSGYLGGSQERDDGDEE